MSRDLTFSKKLYKAFDPFRPLPANDPAWVDCREVRGDEDIITGLGTEILLSEGVTCQLYAGHRGAGKSTELLRFKQFLEEQNCFVVYFEADEDIDTEDTQYTDILLACTRHLLEAFKDCADPSPLLNWLQGCWGELKELALTEVSLEHLNIQAQISQFPKLTANLRTVSSQRYKIRERIDPHITTLIKALNQFIKEARKNLPVDSSQLVLIVDNLEKIVPVIQEDGRINHDKIFLDRSKQLKALDCNLVYTVPISMLYSNRAADLLSIYGDVQILPMIMIRKPDNSVYLPGLDLLKEVISKRVSRVLSDFSLEIDIFDGREPLHKLCLMSGGNLRELMLLMQGAIKNTDISPIPAKAVQRSITERRDIYRRTVEKDQWSILAEVYRSKQIKNDDKYRTLLLNRCLLEYVYFDKQGERQHWYDVHPLILDLASFQEALEIKKSEYRYLEYQWQPSNLQNLLISEIELSNIRCFEQIKLNLGEEKAPISWLMILGDNAVGKSTLLRSIALGLCHESDAVALMKSLPGEFVRKGATEGYIKIQLQDEKNPSQTYTITTRIIKTSDRDGREIIRQETEPNENFPWGEIFACGYGAYRSAQASVTQDRYRVIDAVRSLFDSQASLQNPEVILLRQVPEIRQQLERKLLNILMLDGSDNQLSYTQQGLEVAGHWGRQPFQVLSDGYRSTVQWVLDFLSWAIYANRLSSDCELGGILLIDEIEQHLHPRWQRYIVQRLRQQFPKTQIIASTHTPLAASGIVDVDPSLLVKLEQNSEGKIDLRVIDKQLLKGKRADQVLVSEAFGLVTTQNPGSKDDINRYAELLGKSSRTEAEEAELQELRSYLQDAFQFGENEVERTVKKAVDEALESMTQNISPELLDLETKKQLKEIFQSEVSL